MHSVNSEISIQLQCGVSGFSIASINIIIQFWLNMIVVDLSMNISRSYNSLIMTEYFIDEKKYFYLIAFHINTAICIALAVTVPIGTMYMTYYQFTYGMFKIASYRIEHAINVLQNITLKKKIPMTKGIMCAVDIHRQAIKVSTQMMSTFSISLGCLILCGVICLSLNLFQIASFQNDVRDIIVPSLVTLAIVMYMFFSSLIGQTALDYNNYVYATVYNVQWYRTPLHVQKMILFLLQRRAKDFTLNVGGLIHSSMDMFATLVKASITYYTVIHSTM